MMLAKAILAFLSSRSHKLVACGGREVVSVLIQVGETQSCHHLDLE